MPENNRKRQPGKENPFREWVSDNLRYIILIAVIVAAAILILFVITSILRPSDGTGEQAGTSGTVSETSGTLSGSSVPGDTSSDSETEAQTPGNISGSSSAGTSNQNSTGEISDSAEPAQTPESGSAADALTDADPAVWEIVMNYFTALSNADAENAASLVEEISEEDKSSIASGAYRRNYSDFTVYSYPGDEEGTSVALVVYKYQYDGFETAVPAMTEFYILTRDDGSLCIGSDATQAAKSGLLSKALENEEARQIRQSVEDAYDAALAADPALAAYLAGVNE